MTDVQPSMVDIQSKHIVMESESMTALVTYYNNHGVIKFVVTHFSLEK